MKRRASQLGDWTSICVVSTPDADSPLLVMFEPTIIASKPLVLKTDAAANFPSCRETEIVTASVPRSGGLEPSSHNTSSGLTKVGIHAVDHAATADEASNETAEESSPYATPEPCKTSTVSINVAVAMDTSVDRNRVQSALQ